MDIVVQPSKASSHGQLKVVRASSHKGFWFWRRAKYIVYQEQSDGTRFTVLKGHFRNHKEALSKANDLT